MLQALGYEIMAVTKSLEALESFRNRPNDFDLVITDCTMPRIAGLNLAREITKIRPEIPIILCSGFSEKITEDKVKEMGVRAFVMKPFDLNSIATRVRQALDGG